MDCLSRDENAIGGEMPAIVPHLNSIGPSVRFVMSRRYLRILFLVISWPVMVFCGTTGSLEGHVMDGRTGKPLVGANVLLVQTKQGVETDSSGFFKINNIRAGSYRVRVSMIGYRMVTSKDIAIRPDLRSAFSVQLEEAPIEMEAIEVTHERPLIETDITGTAYEIESETLIDRPLDTIQQVVELQPGTTVEGHIRGGKIHEAIYLIDGLPVQDVTQGGPAAELPLSAISQMSIKTGGFDAEYGNALSGVINVITQSGGDDHQVSIRGRGGEQAE